MEDLESFVKQEINKIEDLIKAEEELLKVRNKVIYDKIEQLKTRQQPLKKILMDYNKAKSAPKK